MSYSSTCLVSYWTDPLKGRGCAPTALSGRRARRSEGVGVARAVAGGGRASRALWLLRGCICRLDMFGNKDMEGGLLGCEHSMTRRLARLFFSHGELTSRRHSLPCHDPVVFKLLRRPRRCSSHLQPRVESNKHLTEQSQGEYLLDVEVVGEKRTKAELTYPRHSPFCSHATSCLSPSIAEIISLLSRIDI